MVVSMRSAVSGMRDSIRATSARGNPLRHCLELVPPLRHLTGRYRDAAIDEVRELVVPFWAGNGVSQAEHELRQVQQVQLGLVAMRQS